MREGGEGIWEGYKGVSSGSTVFSFFNVNYLWKILTFVKSESPLYGYLYCSVHLK